MSYRRYNVSPTTVNFTGATTGAKVYSNSLFIGETDRRVGDLSARVVATLTVTSATLKATWQGSNDNSTFDDLAHSPENPATVAFLTGTVSATATLAIGAPQGIYGYKYARLSVLLTSTTAGSTNDALVIGLNYRQLDV